jgi:DNA repair protein RecN (Recombination protein N)
MLTRLKISNFLLIDNLELDFNCGLTVVTGETGSGKSIIIDALMILFGAKATETIIRHGQKQAIFEAEFNLSNSNTQNWLHENDLHDVDEQTQVICRRVIDCSGKSKTYINGHAVTITQMRICGDFILDIHTQHASITLLKADMQRKLLDEYAGITQNVEQLSSLFKQIQRLDTDLITSMQQMRELDIRRQYLLESITDLTDTNIKPNEWQELEVKHKQLANANAVLQELNEINNLLMNSDDSVLEGLHKLQTKLNKIAEYLPKAAELIGFVSSAEAELGELRYGISDVVNDIEQNPDALTEIETRINQLFDLSRKYRCTPESLEESLILWQQELQAIDAKIDIDTLQQELDAVKIEYFTIAETISSIREEVSRKLSGEITEVLNRLSIRGEFRISLKKLGAGVLSGYGLETVEYQICFNRGMEFQPLAKAASGGELSRTALALYLILSIHNPPEVIIFDEIDVGIGGKVAATVGQMLYDLGKIKQIICITHQPQTASFGNIHLVVSKEDSADNNTTLTLVKHVREQSRINEIARMLGGIEITEATLDHAREMLLMTEQ